MVARSSKRRLERLEVEAARRRALETARKCTEAWSRLTDEELARVWWGIEQLRVDDKRLDSEKFSRLVHHPEEAPRLVDARAAAGWSRAVEVGAVAAVKEHCEIFDEGLLPFEEMKNYDPFGMDGRRERVWPLVQALEEGRDASSRYRLQDN